MSDPYTHVSRAEVLRLHRKADQAQRMNAYVDACAHRVWFVLSNTTDPELEAVALATFAAVVHLEQGTHMPRACYIRPVKRWSGGPVTTPGLGWYWDKV